MSLPLLPAAFILLPIGSPHQSLPVHLSSAELAGVGSLADAKHLVAMALYLPILKRALIEASVFHYQLAMT